MKILILANKIPYPPLDGGSIATLNMITGLQQAGNEITALSLNTLKHNYPIEKIPEDLTSSIRFMAIDCDSRIRIIPLLMNFLFSKKPYIAQRFSTKAFRKSLNALLTEEQFQVIQLEGPYCSHYLDTIKNKSNATISLRAHNVEHLIWQRKAVREKSAIKRWYLRNMAQRLKQFEIAAVNQSNCLVTISPLDEAYFIESGYTGSSITIPTGFNLEQYPKTGLPVNRDIFFIGALDWLPNQEGLIWFLDSVFEELTVRIPGIRFHIAGRNAPGHFVKILRHKSIVYHGEVKSAKEFMQAYRVMVSPLFTGSGIRIKILESMALGRPVVTTTVGAEGIPAENNRHLLVADTPEIFINQVINLLSDDKIATTLAAGARQIIKENFDTFGLSNRLSQFFKEQV